MPGRLYNRLTDIAAEQYGLVTAAAANELGMTRKELSVRLGHMAQRGTLEKISYGTYRVPAIPTTPLDHFMEAVFWPHRVHGVLSHETALEMYELSDVNPTKIHLTVPAQHRITRPVPSLYAIHHRTLDPDEVTLYEGIPVVTIQRALEDTIEAHLGPRLTRAAIDQARARGLISKQQLRALTEQLEDNGR